MLWPTKDLHYWWGLIMAKTRQPADKIVLREILAEVRAIRAVLEPEAPVDTGPVGPGRYGAGIEVLAAHAVGEVAGYSVPYMPLNVIDLTSP